MIPGSATLTKADKRRRAWTLAWLGCDSSASSTETSSIAAKTTVLDGPDPAEIRKFGLEAKRLTGFAKRSRCTGCDSLQDHWLCKLEA